MRPCKHTSILAKSRYKRGTCRICWLYFNNQEYHELWKGDDINLPVETKTIPSPPKSLSSYTVTINEVSCGKEFNGSFILNPISQNEWKKEYPWGAITLLLEKEKKIYVLKITGNIENKQVGAIYATEMSLWSEESENIMVRMKTIHSKLCDWSNFITVSIKRKPVIGLL